MIHQARKRFGQNFLSDPNIIRKIVDTIAPQPGQRMVEIGPGLAAMTDPLLARLGKMDVVEIDRDLIALLKERYSSEQLTIHEGDALKFDFSTLGPDLRIVGNLPYNISTPILFHLADFADQVRDMTFMLQKEVVMRMVADPGTSEFGRLSVMLQYRFRMGRVFDVPPGAFRPAPKVMSSIVRLVPRPTESLEAKDDALLRKIVTAAFGQRRKTLRNTLRDYIDEAGLTALGIDPGQRAERLSVANYVAITNACCAKRTA
ncbi:MAG TPA: 16S rRNA (adenine(1518)-N(6)/adenine(1519)-N(6))-dimethyltransferase RsmA [Denitromonas sp.]|mgnify:CR=1 FL=1|uniref:16S rRNA (adenine(1518)-N(6)/adenine(1519)-N(6))- dimethyltransferase RsmA n=1 Tax=Denitromonas sp. TaxID=2734609 RepID=UPI001DA85A63|nr:16S rRNA (adenine(1518)-N(6)/adenine(1519)-N(6))-dimethyltransferase RsmA [Rhodocyclaceae bacterium]MCP5221533.1 16S rRNA (adenine(1518)-N(6)/adenine(1519)-N(6))-dimethyltransferase RsmA [Zoogloeaceae bacterium]HPR05486.1 16S rRNA (adenine(1518)-N(6)/adenine(1519)-N(6))-dimethyltransferase RsmA [Denitromonas sp.]HQU88999.1 16S rRNA (adenine(1518)-N(6)/adenine(1519)-N(6))-dimethyltransferase RsmA [Denitromonas sp.]HQV14867.1 16S rRNA (adenine(1518)-N(6)/adenine(1519)-N(6))-dimethyltransferase